MFCHVLHTIKGKKLLHDMFTQEKLNSSDSTSERNEKNMPLPTNICSRPRLVCSIVILLVDLGNMSLDYLYFQKLECLIFNY